MGCFTEECDITSERACRSAEKSSTVPTYERDGLRLHYDVVAPITRDGCRSIVDWSKQNGPLQEHDRTLRARAVPLRVLAMCAAVVLLAVGCGNAASSKPVTVPTTKPGAPPVTEVSSSDLQKKVALPGVEGVTDDEIKVAVITAGTNPLAGDYTSFASGIQAYFDMINTEGGIYGRKLAISANRNDGFINNQQEVKASLAQDHAFATFVATALFYGAATSRPANP